MGKDLSSIVKSLIVTSFFLLFGCSKDLINVYKDRIEIYQDGKTLVYPDSTKTHAKWVLSIPYSDLVFIDDRGPLDAAHLVRDSSMVDDSTNSRWPRTWRLGEKPRVMTGLERVHYDSLVSKAYQK